MTKYLLEGIITLIIIYVCGIIGISVAILNGAPFDTEAILFTFKIVTEIYLIVFIFGIVIRHIINKILC